MGGGRGRSEPERRWTRKKIGVVYFKNFCKIGIVIFLFVFDKYCSIMD
jgi:hypothetical protein